MTTVYYQARPVGVVGPRSAFLLPHTPSTLAPGPWLRALCMYALDVECGLLDGPYQQAQAEAYARALLIDDTLLDCRDDAWLARRFGIPIEQIRLAREDHPIH